LQKSLQIDFGLWALLGMNAYVIYYYTAHPDSYPSIVALYWVQSVCIGLFNFIALLIIPRTAEDDKYDPTGKKGNGCTAFFFLFHYGVFHLVYFVFIAGDIVKSNAVDWLFLRNTSLLILASSALNFIQDAQRMRKQEANMGVMFFMPYARIIPMHLMILAPKFLGISAAYVFLVLKTIADIIMHFVYQKLLFKQKAVNSTNIL